MASGGCEMVVTFAREGRQTRYVFTAVAALAILASFMVPAAHADLAKKLGFVQQPSGVTAGRPITPAVTVAVLDQQGRVVTDSTAQITITATGPGLLAGDDQASAGSGGPGVASFSNLRLTLRGAYTLTASSSGLDPATSDPFTVTGATDNCTAAGCAVSDPDGTNATATNRVTGSGTIKKCNAVDDRFISYDEPPGPPVSGCNGTCDDPVDVIWDCAPDGTVLLIYVADKTVVQEDLDRGSPHFTIYANGLAVPTCTKKGVLGPSPKCISRQYKTNAGDLVTEILSSPTDIRMTH